MQQGPSFDEIATIVGRIVLNNALTIDAQGKALQEMQSRIATLEEAAKPKD